jgi:AGZA family xanthine/uracil permease-like MFS transporter
MAQSLVGIDWPDVTESTPALLTAIMMPLSFSVANGIGIGFISYVSIKLLARRHNEVPAAVYVIAVIFAGKFAFL